MPRALPLVTLAVVLTVGATRAQSVLTVDDDGGAAFVSIQAAIDAAAPGDVVLVRDGVYGNFVMSGKGVAVVADQGAMVQVLAPTGTITTTIRSVPAGQTARLRGIRFTPPSRVDGALLHVDRCAGTVWVEDITLDVAPALPFVYFLNQTEAVLVEGSDRVVIVRSTVRGADGAPQGAGSELGSAALRCRDSSVFVHGAIAQAGRTTVLGGTGQPAIEVIGGLLVLRDTTAAGGTGGPGFLPSPSGDGGPALQIDGGAEAWSIGCTLTGGAPGPVVLGSMGHPGPPWTIVSGTLNEDPSAAATLTTTRITRDVPHVGSIDLDLQSVPSSQVILLASFAPSPLFLAALPEFVGVGPSPILAPAGATDATGAFALSIGVPALVGGLQTWSVTVQLAVITPTFGIEASNPSIVTVVDDGF